MDNFKQDTTDRLLAFTHMDTHTFTLDPRYTRLPPGEMSSYYGQPLPQNATPYISKKTGFRYYTLPDGSVHQYTGRLP